MMLRKSISATIFTISFFFPVTAQTTSSGQIKPEEQLLALAENAPSELIYIQTSKDIYETGEDLWFKAYVLNSQFLTPSSLSKTLYLQLLNEATKKSYWQEIYEIRDGFADGQVYIDNSLPDGDYLLTTFSQNSFYKDSTEFKTLKKIKITSDITKTPSLTARFDKDFYNPEDTIKLILSPQSTPADSMFVDIAAVIQQQNKKLQSVQTKTNPYGDAVVSFLPVNAGKGVTVTMNLKYPDRTESIVMPLTYKENPIQFTVFPEGGNLVSGIESKVAFYAVKRNGEPVDIQGTLFEDNTPLLNIKSLHAGMGSFVFTPNTDKNYFIRLSQPFTDSTFLLPDAYSWGIVMNLAERDDKSITFRIVRNSGNNPEEIYLRVQCRGIVCGITKVELNREIKIKIPLEALPQGIIEVTIYNSNLLPLAERLVYINSGKKLNITSELSRDIYPTRGKVNIKITVKDENGKPAKTNLGVSVFEKLYQNQVDSGNFLSYTYLSTQIKGRIYNPAYYFNSASSDCELALDLLMLTQGWRRYIWNERELALFNEPPKQVVSDGIKGVVTIPSLSKKRREEQKTVMAFSPEIDTNKVFIIADSTGRFTIDPDLLKNWQGDYIYLKPVSATKNTPKIKIIYPFKDIDSLLKKDKITYQIPAILSTNESSSDLILTISDQIVIDEIVIKGNNSTLIHGKYLGLLDSLAKFSIDGDYVCMYGFLNCLNHPRGFEGTTKPVVGKTYDIQLGDGTFGRKRYSIISPPLSEEELLKINNLSRVKSYYANLEFYQPNYDKASNEDILPDYRNTLLWAPAVITDENGEATISFFCSDIYADFVGRIEGVSHDGLLGSESFKFTVRKLNITP